MNYDEYIANANLAFAGGAFNEAIKYSEKAISCEPKRVEAYICAGKASISLNRLTDAVNQLKSAIDISPKDGNIIFLLGYAYILQGSINDGMKCLTRSLENGCDKDTCGQIYKMMSMINTEQSDYKNALLNLEQAEDYLGLDLEILQQKAACYAYLHDYHQTLFTLNQIKLLKPNEYSAYNLAFNIFMELEIFDEALAELERAEKYADLTMLYYNDRIAYTLLHDPKNDTKENIKNKWNETLKAIQIGMDKGKPTAEQVFELYLRAAQLYISLENPNEAVKMLDAAVNPVTSFNNHFTVYKSEDTDDEMLSYSDNDMLSPEDEEILMQEKWENGEFDDIREGVSNVLYETMSDDPEEISEEVNAYLSPIDAIPSLKEDKADYVLSGEFHMKPVQYDMRNSMYIAAYEMLEDYESMLLKARELQSSSIVPNQYSGIYYELKYGKYTNKENWQKKYRERISFWTKRMLEDPTDFISASYRIRSYIDIGDFENAELLCACLPTDVKESLMQEISNAKSQGGGENGDTH